MLIFFLCKKAAYIDINRETANAKVCFCPLYKIYASLGNEGKKIHSLLCAFHTVTCRQ